MPGSQLRQEVMEVATSDIKGDAMVNALYKAVDNPDDDAPSQEGVYGKND